MKNRTLLLLLASITVLTLAIAITVSYNSKTVLPEPDAGPAEILMPGSDEAEKIYVPNVPDREITVEITEVMYSNKTSIRDSYGNFSDWIEFENIGSDPCSLEGFWLSDDNDDLMKWRFPNVSIGPGERLLVFCSGRESTAEELHASFSLAKEGDPLYFSYPSGTVRTAVTPNGKMDDDVSLCISGEISYTTYYATPGFPNTEEGRLAFIEADDVHGDLVINEACPFNETYKYLWGGFYDWIELKNVSSAPIRLSNYYLTDDPSEPEKYRLPKTTLQPGKTVTPTSAGIPSAGTVLRWIPTVTAYIYTIPTEIFQIKPVYIMFPSEAA